MITEEERIKKIVERWFLLEPLMFNIFCTHKLEKNLGLKVPFRSGKMKIEYSPLLLQKLSDKALEEYLKVEVFRIVLKHPYDRVPQDANKVALGFASDVTIEQISQFTIPLLNYAELGLAPGLSYEEYYRDLKFRPIAQLDYGNDEEEKHSDSNQQFSSENKDCSNQHIDSDNQDSSHQQPASENKDCSNQYTNSDNQNCSHQQNDEENHSYSDQQKAAENVELWQEDDLAIEVINMHIIKAQESNEWGTISGKLQQMIEANLIVRMDYKKVLSSFRASILSQNRELTRTRPNRRYGFDFMGSHYKFTTKLLVAVDVSGSISDKELSKFFSIINRFFKYGIKNIDVIQFDFNITAPVMNLKKAKKSIKVTGRGGTSFQPPIDYYTAHKEYDGLIIFTDGYAEIPRTTTYRRILWVLTNEKSYSNAINWIKTMANNKVMYIPK